MRPTLYLILSACLWGLNFHLLQVMLSSVNFIEAGFWRHLFGIGALGILISNNTQIWINLRTHLKGILIVSLLGLFGFNLLLFYGLNFTSSINASLIISLNPLVTIFLAKRYFGTPISTGSIIGALLSLLGVAWLISKGELLSPETFTLNKGDCLVFAAMILSSLYHIWTRKYSTGLSNRDFTFLSNLVCFLAYLLFFPLATDYNWEAYPFNFWIAAAAFGVLGTAVTYYFWNKGLSSLGPSQAGVYMNIVPLATAAFSIILGKSLEDYHVISGLFILGGLFLSHLKLKPSFIVFRR